MVRRLVALPENLRASEIGRLVAEMRANGEEQELSVPLTIAELKASLSAVTPPAGLSGALLALWHDGRGDWDAAHRVAQDIDDADGSWIHAYLHRKEGDAGNAAYWYRRAGQPVATASLDAEWEQIVTALLEKG